MNVIPFQGKKLERKDSGDPRSLCHQLLTMDPRLKPKSLNSKSCALPVTRMCSLLQLLFPKESLKNYAKGVS